MVGVTETEVAEIKPDATSVQQKQVMGDNVLTVSFTHPENPSFQVGDYCTVYEERYQLNQPALAKKLGENRYQFSLRLEAEYFDLSKVQFLNYGADDSLRESDFTLMLNARGFIDLLLKNALRVSVGWKKGDVQATTYKNLSFSKENCLGVLQRLSEEFSLEWAVEGKTIHLSKRRLISNLKFRHGRNKGLYTITRQPLSGSKLVTRLYAYGSDKNLPAGYRNYTTRLKMTGGLDYLEANTAQGIIEDTAVFEDIYPHRVGKVTAIGADIYTFYDLNLDFDVRQYLLPAVEAKLTFQTGQLAGYTFKLSPKSNFAAKEIILLPNTEEKALQIPSDLLHPQVGDTYVLTDIAMPQAYIDAAERALKREAQKLLNKISVPQYSYTIDFDPAYMKRRTRVIGVGEEVTIQDSDLGVDQRLSIVSCTRNLVNEYQFQVEVSDQKTKGTLSQIQSNLSSNARDISTIKNTYTTLQDNKVVGDFTVDKGSIIFSELPVVDSDLTGYATIYVNRQTGKLYREA
jgi:hypothetical protein